MVCWFITGNKYYNNKLDYSIIFKNILLANIYRMRLGLQHAYARHDTNSRDCYDHYRLDDVSLNQHLEDRPIVCDERHDGRAPHLSREILRLSSLWPCCLDGDLSSCDGHRSGRDRHRDCPCVVPLIALRS